MARTFSEPVRRLLAKKTGLTPIIIIGVKWRDNLEVFYSSTPYTGAQQTLLELTGLETTTSITNNGASQSVTVTLSDSDGYMRQVLDSIDIHKRPANVYLGFVDDDGSDIAVSQMVPLIQGEINSQMIWDERARTLRFSILNKIEGRLFGFAVEDGLIEKVDESERTTPWPFRFGETCMYPAIRIRNGVKGLLRLGQGVLDPTLDAKICQARQIKCPLIEDPLCEGAQPSNEENVTLATNTWNANNVPGTDLPFANGPDTFFGTRLANPVNGAGQSGGTGLANPENGCNLVRDRECERAKFQTLCQLLRDRANQLVYVQDQLLILGGDEFPQNRETQIRIDDVIYTGIFTGELFTILSTNRLDTPTDNVDCRSVGPYYSGYRESTEEDPGSLAACEQATQTYTLQAIGGAGEAWRLLDNLADSEFKWLPAGSEVFLDESSTEVHIVSLIPGTVVSVAAYRTLGDTRQLSELPGEYYEVVETNYGDLTATEIWLDRPLSSYPDEKWDDELYVTFESDIGPNPVDVIQWIVETYTSFEIDATNFAAVKSLLTKYPCNYYHNTKDNVISVLGQIAFEARCALFITDNTVRLSYLPKEPDADATMTTADIVAGSFKMSLSRTEDLQTNITANWQPWGAPMLDTSEPVRRFTVQRNVEKYGYFGTEHSYRTINNEAQALKTATYWSIRNSNTWKRVSFQTSLEHMNLELYDCIQLNINPTFPNIKVIIESMRVEPTQGTITFDCWTPILSGTTEEYLWAWPAAQPVEPYPDDNFDIESPLLQVSPPPGHPLYIDTNDDTPQVSVTAGDRFPTDLDDVFPTTVCQDLNDPELFDALEPIFDRIEFIDFQGQATRADEVASNNPDFNFEEPEENEVCGRPSFEDCVWEVWVQYGSAASIGWDAINPGQLTISGTLESGCKPVPNGPCNTTGRGQRCIPGPGFFRCRTFGSELMAGAFAAAIRAQINAGYCSWRVGNVGPISVTGPIKHDNTGPAETCVGMGNTQVSSGSYGQTIGGF